MTEPSICGRCGEEIRHGVREGVTGWWHRENVDHLPIHGTVTTPEMLAEIERQLDLPRERLAKGVAAKCPTYQRFWPPEIYTTREHDLERYRKQKKFREMEALEAEQDDEPVEPLPPVEIPCHPVEPDTFAPRSGIRQVINLLPKHGWELRRLTRARGPYVGSSGELLSISDTIVLGALDENGRVAVASWRDGKFDFAYAGTITDGHLSTTKVNATEMKDWIKGPMTPDTPEATKAQIESAE